MLKNADKNFKNKNIFILDHCRQVHLFHPGPRLLLPRTEAPPSDKHTINHNYMRMYKHAKLNLSLVTNSMERAYSTCYHAVANYKHFFFMNTYLVNVMN